MKNIIFISSYFDMSEKEAITWIDYHSQEEIDSLWKFYIN